jgi:hypothetical protein
MNVQVQAVDGMRCRCGRQPLLHVEMPDPDAPAGRSTRVLCAFCDAGSPTGAALLAFFATHPVVGEHDVDELSALLRRWLEDITPADLDVAELNTARAAWQQPS